MPQQVCLKYPFPALRYQCFSSGSNHWSKGGRSANKFNKSQIRKFAGLRFADWDTKEIGRIAICGLNITLQNCDLRINHYGTNLRICGLAHLRNLRICDCGMRPRICGRTTKICVLTFGYYINFSLERLVNTSKNLATALLWTRKLCHLLTRPSRIRIGIKIKKNGS